MTPEEERRLLADLADMRRQIAVLTDRFDRLDINGLDVARTGSVFLPPGGNNGVSTLFARADHDH